MPMRPESATICPRFFASLSGALISTRRFGVPGFTSSTELPAARITSPFGLVMIPLFVTLGPTRYTCPPDAALIAPWFTTEPAPGTSVKRSRPPRKSAFERLSDEATSPATSICEPAPNMIPLGLIRKTRPFDCRAPRITDGSIGPPAPTTRFSIALAADCCVKRVISLAPIENDCQLMIELGELVMLSRLPAWLIVTWPFTTVAPVGFASAGPAAKQEATARAISLGLRSTRELFLDICFSITIRAPSRQTHWKTVHHHANTVPARYRMPRSGDYICLSATKG